MRILVTGSRSWEDSDAIVRALADAIERGGYLPPIDGLEDVTLVHGACPRGADAMADSIGQYWAQRFGLNVERHPAQWQRPDGSTDRAAGFRRNADMVNAGADICLAFIRDGSPGASMTADLAESAGIFTIRYTA